MGLEYEFPLGIKIYAKGGYSYIDKNHKYFSASIGTSFTIPKSVLPSSPVRIPMDNSFVIRDTVLIPHRQIVVIGSPDFIIAELNIAIETALTRVGMPIISWDRVRDRVTQHYRDRSASISNVVIPDHLTDVNTWNEMDIAMEGARLMGIDRLIKTRLRYEYRSSIEKIRIKSAYIQIIHPISGELLWATDYETRPIPFSDCKQILIPQIMQALIALR